MSGETVLGRDSEGRVREYDLATQQELDAGGGADPTTLSRLRASMGASITGVASGATAIYDWDTVGEVVGADIEVDGDDSTLINILADGVYAVSLLGEVDFGTPSDGVDATFDLQAGGVDPTIDVQVKADITADYAVVAVPLGPYFLPVGTQIAASANCHTGGGTWSLVNSIASLLVQRVA